MESVLRGLLLAALLAAAAAKRSLWEGPAAPEQCTKKIRSSINWGVATAAYQIEGAWNESGRSPSVWDVFSHMPGKIKNNATGDVACDHYHKYKEDFKLMRDMGIRNYRFSISWSRILPGGARGTPVNPEGIKFYNDIIDEMIANKITPAATMFHWDLPQVQHDKYRGPLGREFVDDFVNYADVLLTNFGDRVKTWMTFNEPLITCDASYGAGHFAPGYKGGSEGTYLCAHNILLAHAKAKQMARKKHWSKFAKVGIALNVEWAEPMHNTTADKAAAQRNLDMQLGLFADPLFYGTYPSFLKRKFGGMIQRFSADEVNLVKGSLDFIGINFYTAKYVRADSGSSLGYRVSQWSSQGDEIGPQAQSSWLRVVPDGIYKITQYVTKRYGAPEIVITENGVSAPGEAGMTKAQAIKDSFRVDYYRSYLDQLCRSRADGAKIRGYYAWSFMDNFEWLQGYTERFGIVHVDFGSPGLERTVKDSGRYLSENFFKAGRRWRW